MPTIKPRFSGDGAGELLPDFSDSLREYIRQFYPVDMNVPKEEYQPFAHPAEDFINHVLSEAWVGKSDLYFLQFESNKSQIVAELANLDKYLGEAEWRLRKLSPDVDRLLGIDADPLGCADSLAELVSRVSIAENLARRISSPKNRRDQTAEILVEMSIRVLRVLAEYGINAAATGNTYYEYDPPICIKILKAIGDDIGVGRELITWRDIVAKAKRLAPDLKA